MKKLIPLGLVASSLLLTACASNDMGQNPGVTTYSGNYNRDKVCANLARQLGLSAGQGLGSSNWEENSRMDRLATSYKANGCDK
ncbi:MAG: hypothetical protein CMF50_06690 [Legionellales bacterium]|nr:hypothetical protein [Legionellales bacterium]|tara:strand:+ start:18356 stop:18607 length:252 start_codon:yes stop_codon:yes gene_type:complete